MKIGAIKKLGIIKLHFLQKHGDTIINGKSHGDLKIHCNQKELGIKKLHGDPKVHGNTNQAGIMQQVLGNTMVTRVDTGTLARMQLGKIREMLIISELKPIFFYFYMETKVTVESLGILGLLSLIVCPLKDDLRK